MCVEITISCSNVQIKDSCKVGNAYSTVWEGELETCSRECWSSAACEAFSHYRGTSLIRNSPPPWDHHRALGIALL